jgi:addiction module RelE/StbE family toxin
MGDVSWTEKASKHLQGIYDYIARDSPIYASRLVKRLITSTKPLQDLPRMGHVVPEFTEYGFREIIRQDYRIIYRILENDDVEILAVIHGARDIMGAYYEE